jgi:hypothetical protein
VIGQLPQIASEQTGSGSALRTYVYGRQGAISITTPSQTSYLYHDPLGSITDSCKSNMPPPRILQCHSGRVTGCRLLAAGCTAKVPN